MGPLINLADSSPEAPSFPSWAGIVSSVLFIFRPVEYSALAAWGQRQLVGKLNRVQIHHIYCGELAPVHQRRPRRGVEQPVLGDRLRGRIGNRADALVDIGA